MLPVNTFIGLGSNLNDPVQQLQTAIVALRKIKVTKLLLVSSFYRNPQLNRDDQPDYVNAVAQLETKLSPEELLQSLQEIEMKQGRIRTEQQWGQSRTLDMDILLYSDISLNKKNLVIPHPGLTTRNFFLYPLFEIAPTLILPSNILLKDLVNTCDNTQLEKIP